MEGNFDECGNNSVGNNVWLNSRGIVLPKVKMGRRSRISASSLVTNLSRFDHCSGIICDVSSNCMKVVNLIET